MPGKHSPGQKHFNQYNVTEKCVRCGLLLSYWPKDGCTGKHPETVPCPLMLAEVIRRLHESRTEPTKLVFEETSKMVKSEARLRTDFSDARVGPEHKTGGDDTCDTEDCNSSHHWRRRVRKHGNTTVDGTLSGADVTHKGTVAAYMVTTTSEHGAVRATNLSKSVPEVVVESTRK